MNFIQKAELPVPHRVWVAWKLLTRPSITSRSGMSKEDRHRLGITDSLIRMSVGIDATEEIIADFEQALS